MNLKLVKPNKKYLASVYEAVSEYQKEPSEFEIIAVSKMIAAAENNFKDYFENTENDSLGINLKSGYVAHTVFWLVDDDNYIGTFNLRHSLTPALAKIGGHIAYQIRPSKYRQGYAYEGLKLCLKEAAKMGIDKALITCNADNISSYSVMHKVMLEYGGYEDEIYKEDNQIEKRVWIRTEN